MTFQKFVRKKYLDFLIVLINSMFDTIYFFVRIGFLYNQKFWNKTLLRYFAVSKKMRHVLIDTLHDEKFWPLKV